MPISSVQALPAESADSTFQVNWSGLDDATGSGIGDYSVYVAVDGGPFSVWLENTQLTSAPYVGDAGRDYQFYSIARDNGGNVEAAPAVADAFTSTPGLFGDIGDRVWNDTNGDGIQNPAEVGFANVTVSLFRDDGSAQGELLESVQTDANGNYLFADLDTSETYFLTFVAPSGFAFTDSDQGTDETLDSDADIVTGQTAVFSINGGDNLQFDVGLIEFAEIGGVLWHDVDADAIQDQEEPLLQGWTVYLDTDSDGVLDVDETSVQTGLDGSYRFVDLRPGEYVVAQIVPEGWMQTFPGVAGAFTLLSQASDVELTVPGTATENADTTTPASQLINLDTLNADPQFAGVDGSGYSVVVIDTGLDVDHPFFGPDADGDGIADRIVYQYDFADDDNDASDRTGHGSHVSSIIGSEDSVYGGIAPGVDIVHLKVFEDDGAGYFAYVEQALQWVVANAATFNVAAVNLSVGDGLNWTQATGQYGLADELAAIAAQNIITVSAAGNGFASFDSHQGLSYPAADPNTISVGAVWDADRGSQTFSGSGADYSTAADRITSFSQRHGEITDTFAPGALITGASEIGGVAAMRGTSMASPFVAGAAVLAQQVAMDSLGRMLTLAEFRSLLQVSGAVITDGDDEDDNVANTGLSFSRLDVHALAQSVHSFTSATTDDDVSAPDEPSPDGTPFNLLAGLPNAYSITLVPGQIRDDVDFGTRPINSAPEVDAGADETIDEGEKLTRVGSFTDFDPGDSWTATVDYGDGSGPAPLTLTDQSFQLDHPYQDNGVYQVVIEVVDAAGDIGTAQFSVTVDNLAPTLTVNEETVSADEGSIATNAGTFGDPGADDVSLSASTGVVVDNGDGTWNWSFDTNDGPDQSQVITITATDDDDATTSMIFSLVVNNVAPSVASDNATVTADEGSTAINSGTFSDPGVDNVTMTSSAGDVIDNGNGTWSWIFDTSDGPDDSQTVTVTATDSDGTVTSTTFDLIVANVAPTVSADNATVTIDEGATASNSGAFADVGNDGVTLSATAGTVIDNGDGTWSWSFDTSDGPDDSQTVTVTATDSDGAVTSTTFDLTVANVAPTVSADDATVAVNEGSTATNAGPVGDPGTDVVVLSSSVGDITDNGDGTWMWDLDTTDGPGDSQTVTITATDSDGASTTTTFDLVVNNVAPSVGADNATLTFVPGGVVTNTGTFSDPGMDPVTLSSSAGTITETGSGQWQWSLATTSVDDAQIVTITATDSDGAITSITFAIVADGVGPTIESLGTDATLENKANENDVVTLTGSFSGSNLDTHSVSIDWGDGTQSSAAVNEVQQTFDAAHTFAHGGLYTVTVTLSDDDGNVVMESTSAVIIGVGLRNGLLQIIGTDDNDDLLIHRQNGMLVVQASFLGDDRNFAAADVSQISILTCDGNDTFWSHRNVRQPMRIESGSGDDFIISGSGNDTILAGSGNDTIIAGRGRDTISGGPGNDWINAQQGRDAIEDLFGNNVIWAGNGADLVTTGDGDDWIFAGRGRDRVFAGGGNDVVFGQDGRDFIDAGAGNDFVYGNNGADILLGGAGDDALFGGNGRDLLIGGDGNDYLRGNDGQDILIGGSTIYDSDESALNQILSDWRSSDSWSDRVAALQTGSGASGLALTSGVEVLIDSTGDDLLGGSGRDWFFAEL